MQVALGQLYKGKAKRIEATGRLESQPSLISDAKEQADFEVRLGDRR